MVTVVGCVYMSESFYSFVNRFSYGVISVEGLRCSGYVPWFVFLVDEFSMSVSVVILDLFLFGLQC